MDRTPKFGDIEQPCSTASLADSIELSVVELDRDTTRNVFGDLGTVLLVGVDSERVVSLVLRSGPVQTTTWRRHVVASRGDRPYLILPDHGSHLP